MTSYPIRVFGDPVLREKAKPVEELDGTLARLVENMIETMYEAPGVGLAAPQVGVQKQLFVFDIGEGPHAVANPEIVESDGTWVYDEGCLSVPGLSFPIVRPKTVTLRGIDLDGHEVVFEADEFEARVFQHELDHLEGVLLLDRLERAERKAALKALREMVLSDAPVERDPTHRL